MKKAVLVLLVLAVCVSLFAGGRKDTGATRIAYLAPHQKNEYQVGLRENVEKYAKLAGVECVVYDADQDPAKMVAHIEQCIASGIKGIITDPASYEGITAGVIAAKRAGVPLVLVHEDVINKEDATSFIGQNFVNGGKQKMEQVMRDFPNGANLAVLYGEVGNKAQIAINEGYREALRGQESKYPYVFDGEGRWAAENALDLVSAWLSSGRPIDAIVCNNDGMAIGALQAVTSVGLAGKMMIYGLDAQQDVCAEIKKGVIRATIFSNSDEEARLGVETVLKAIRGEPVQKEILLPMELVTIDNIDKYLK